MSGRVSRSRSDRREVILDTALSLFNERGTAAVSTNHVAERAGISPGNLYYWFPNKASIIRALLNRWAEESGHPDPWPETGEEVLAALLALLRRQVTLGRKYEVFAREIPALAASDPEFNEEFSALFNARRSALARQAEKLIGASLLRAPAPPLSVGALVDATWMLNMGTLPMASSDEANDVTDAAFVRSASLLIAHLTDEGQRVASHLLVAEGAL